MSNSQKYKVGDYVKKNPDTWEPNDFDSWGRGEGIGQVVDAPFSTEENEIDVRWPGGRCFEYTDQLLPAKEPEIDETKNN